MSEFCRSCGAGIGKFKRNGEGTCFMCDPVEKLTDEEVQLKSAIYSLADILAEDDGAS